MIQNVPEILYVSLVVYWAMDDAVLFDSNFQKVILVNPLMQGRTFDQVYTVVISGPLLLTRFNFNPNMDR